MISYICNREKPECKKYCGNGGKHECHHTSDRNYSVNWADKEPTDEDLKLYFVRYGQHINDPDWYESER